MTLHRFIKPVQPAWLVALAVAGIAATTVGGFQLRVEVPQDDSEVVLLVRTYRCHQPEKATVVGTAEGLVQGQRVSVPIQLKTVGKGVYAVAQQWPAGSPWVLAFSGSYLGHHTSTLVTLAADGQVAFKETESGAEPDVRILNRKLSDADVDSALQRLTDARTPGSRTAKTG
jgi:hypothetical protein